MTSIPLTILDNFLPNPIPVKEFGLNAEYEKTPESYFPGVRTKCLSEIHPPFYNIINKKVLSLFFENANKLNFQSKLYFQKIQNYKGSGWVHMDQNVFTYIIYLTESSLNCGTSFYKLKEDMIYPFRNSDEHNFYLDKRKHYKNKFYSKEDEQKKEFIETNNFTQVLDIKDKFNRLVCFPAEMFHSSNILGDGDSTRLTLIGFITHIGSSNLPLLRTQQITQF